MPWFFWVVAFGLFMAALVYMVYDFMKVRR